MSKHLMVSLTAMILAGLAHPAQADDVRYEQWSNDHRDWVQSHQKEHNYYRNHPEAADRERHKWMNETTTTTHSTNINNNEFSSWAQSHQDWVNAHRDRYEYFRSHPEAAMSSKKEWYDWNPGHKTTTTTSFRTWADTHQDWVRDHRDRYDYFLRNPEAAMSSRNEWYDWKPQTTATTTTFQTWINDHPEWKRTNRKRYQYFLAHPGAAERSRHEWYRHDQPNQVVRTEVREENHHMRDFQGDGFHRPDQSVRTEVRHEEHFSNNNQERHDHRNSDHN